MIVMPNPMPDATSEENNVSLAMKSNGPNLNFALNKFNSVAPIESS